MNRWTVLLVVALVIVGGVVLLFLIRSPSQTDTTSVETAPTTVPIETPAGTATTSDLPSSIVHPPSSDVDSAQKTRFVTATSEARRWQSDAQLFGIEVTTDDLQTPSATYESYVFGSNRDRSNWYLVTINVATNKMVRQLSPKADLYPELTTPVSLTFFKLSPYQALTAAQTDSLGATILSANQLIGYTLQLRHGPPSNYVGWYITFQEIDDRKTTLLVNANSGEVSEAEQ